MALSKIEQISLEVVKVNEFIHKKKEKISQKTTEYSLLNEEITTTRALIDDKKNALLDYKKELQIKADEIHTERQQLNELREKITPILSSFKESLNDLKLQNFEEIR